MRVEKPVLVLSDIDCRIIAEALKYRQSHDTSMADSALDGLAEYLLRVADMTMDMKFEPEVPF